MEDAEEFVKWLDKMLLDSKKKLGMSDESIAYILLQHGTEYYFKTLNKCVRCPYNKNEKD